jgi:hypothetical protein
MRGHIKHFWAAIFMAAIALIAQPVWAQAGGGGTPTDGATATSGGIEIDADGVLSARTTVDPTGRLTMKRLEAARNIVDQDLQKPSKLRKISLRRLEQQVKSLLAAGKTIPDDMQYLAGMTRLSHVFYYPETKDIVVAGPAEGYFRTGENRIVGMNSGSATLQLQDLIVALRAFPASGEKNPLIAVSIDPTQDGLKRMAQAQRNLGNVSLNQRFEIANLFREALGHQTITITGVSPKTHFAQVLVEADYNMKLIGIGLEQPPVNITSFIEAATLRSGNRLQRWFFQPDYQSVSLSEDKYAMELSGSGVKLVGEDETVSAQGQRNRTGGANKASRKFTTSFTKAYDKLAKVRPLYAELRNLIDMSIAAAYIQKMGLYDDSQWGMETFGDESVASVENSHAPTKVDPVVNVVVKGRAIMTPIGGGVNIQPRLALNSDAVKIDTEGKINELKDSISLDELEASQWWWD